jgi:hypothetical protein
MNPPHGWQAMVDLLAVSDAPPPAAQDEGGFLTKVLGVFFRTPTVRAYERMNADLARLGLRVEQLPTQRDRAGSRVDEYIGPTLAEGERHGRAVELRIDPDRYRTRLAGAVPEFDVRSEDGKLLASRRSPAEVHAVVDSIAPDDRWKGVEVKGGPNGIAVFHRFKGGRPSEQGYLDDLWLAETIAARLAQP